MKKKYWFKITLTVFYLFFALLSSAQAADLSGAFSDNTLGAAAGKSYNTGVSLYQIIGTVIQAVLSLLGVIFLMLIIYGGIHWMTAEGEETKIQKAQGIIRAAIIGLIITLAAYAISFFVINSLSQRILS